MQPPTVTTSKYHEPPARELAAVAAYDEACEQLHRSAVPPFRAPSAAGHEGEGVPFAARGAPREIAMATGLVIHAALEFWDGEEPSELNKVAGELARIEADRLEIECEALDSDVTELLAGFHGSELGEHFGTLDIVARELPLLLRDDDGTCWRGSIDLVYRDGDGYTIADYKTDRTSDEGTLRERYAGQLSVYARALRTGLDLAELPRMELWMLRHGRRIVVPAIDPAAEKPEQVKRPAPGKRNKPGQQSLF